MNVLSFVDRFLCHLLDLVHRKQVCQKKEIDVKKEIEILLYNNQD